MTPPPLWRVVAKRTLAVWPLVLASFAAVLLAATLLATGPMYASAAADAGVRRALDDAEPRAAGIDISGRTSGEELAAWTREVTDALEEALPGAVGPVDLVLESDTAPDPDGRRFALASVSRLAEHAELREGSWPTAGAGGALEAALSAPAAEAAGLGVGDTIRLAATRTAEPTTVRVVGLYEVRDSEAAVWWNDPLLLDGVRGRGTRTHGPLVVPRETLLAYAGRFRASWRVRPAGRTLELADLERTAATVAGLEERLRDGVPVGEPTPVVSTGLPALLETARREVGVARSGLLVPLAQLALLAAYGLVFVAALTRRRRRREDELLLMRGADPRALAGASVVEAVALAAVAALAAPWLAQAAIRMLGAVGPVAAAGLDLQPRVDALAYGLAAAGAAGSLLAILLPALRGDRAGRRGPGLLQRTGVDVALLVAAAVTLWQLRSRGAPVVAADGGVDVLLVAIPALGIVAGAILAGRLVPAALDAAARIAGARRGAVAALAARRLARSAHEHRPAAVLLVAALAIGTFAAAYVETWERTQAARAAVAVPADVLVPDDRRTDSYPALGRSTALAAVEGVREVSPFAREQLLVGGSPTPLLTVDAQKAGLAVLAARRPAATGPELGARDKLAVEAEGALEPLPPGVRPQVPSFYFGAPPAERYSDLGAALSVVVADGDGVLHRLPPQPVPGDGETIAFPLGTGGDDTVVPQAPLRLAGIELAYRVPGFVGRTATFELDLPIASEWTVREPAVAPSLSRAGAEVTSAGRMVRIRLRTGSIGFGDRAIATVVLLPLSDEADAAPVAALAGEGLLAALGARVGDVLEVQGRAGRRRLELVGSLPSYPGATEGDSFLVADLPTVFAQRYRARQEVAQPDAWALEVTGPAAPVATAAQRPPLEAESAVSRSAYERSLRNAPLALATAGALWLGFVAAAVFAVAAFAVAGAARARDHAADGAVLTGLGLSRRGRRAVVVLEDATLAVTGAAVGTGLGIALALLVLPAVAFTETGRASVPPPEVALPWPTLALLTAAVAGAIVAAAALRTMRERRPAAAILREPAR